MVDISLKVSFDLHIILVSLFLLAVFCFLIKATVVFVLSFPRLGLQTVVVLNMCPFSWISYKLVVSSRALIRFRLESFLHFVFARTLQRWY